MESVVLARVVRGETVESVHRGHLFIEDCSGETIHCFGNPEAIAFVRSASKPFQAIPFLTSGAADAFGYSDEEIATACASHSGEKIHVRVVAQMLEKAGLSEIYLRCGAHLPFNDKEAERMMREGEPATQLHNNCSGKHAAMLALAKHIGADLATYEQPEHPVQQSIFGVISQFSELAAANIGIGIDGCAAPNFAMPVSAMARSFANLMAPPESFDEETRSACGRIVSAMVRFPELIGGTDRLDTILMKAAPGRLISKVGAEGVWLCGVLPCAEWPSGLAIALKIEDGDDKRARPVVAVQVLRQLGILTNDDLSEIAPMAVKNRRGENVGHVESDVLF